MKSEHRDATQWATDAAERICELDGIRPHLGDDPRYMIAVVARIIDSEHNDQHRPRERGKGGE